MLYLDHDFYSNFNSGVQSGDNEFITDIVVNEISELIVNRSNDVINLMNKVGIKIKDNASDERIVDKILDSISANIKMNKGLAFMVSENNDATKTVKFVTGKDGKKRKANGTRRGATVREIDMVTSGIVGIGDSFKYKPQLKKEFKLNLMRVIETKSNAVGDRSRIFKNSSNGKYLLLTLLLIGAGVGVYFLIKHRKKVAEDGALVDGGTPEPIKTPEPAPVTEPVIEPAPVIDTSTEVPPQNI